MCLHDHIRTIVSQGYHGEPKTETFFLQNSVYSSVKLEYSYLYDDIIIPNFSRVNTGIHHCNRITEQEKLYNNSH